MNSPHDDAGQTQEGVVDVRGVNYAYKFWGDPGAPVMIAFHGWLDNANSFDAIGPQLARQYRVIAVDFLGHGKSSWLPECAEYHFMDLVVDAAKLLRQWSPSRPAIVLGHSLGGAVATCLAALCPECISACITIDALGPLITNEDQLVTKMADAVRFRLDCPRRSPRMMPDFETVVRARQRVEWSIEPWAARQLCLRGAKWVEGGWMWQSDPRWRTPSLLRMTETQVQALLRAIRCPVLVAVAEAGLLRRLPTLTERQQCIPRLRVREFPGGHHLHMESAAAMFGQWVLDEV